jgi:outer membrane protein assembly factor BamA
MRLAISALLLGTTLVAGPAAWAETTYNVSKITITGNKSVPTDQLMAVVTEQPGTKVTVDQIIADQNAITKVLENAHVTGGVKTSVKTVGSKAEIIFAIDDQGVAAPVVTHVAPKLDAQVFEGNNLLSSDTLAAATGLKPGQDLTNDEIVAAQQAIVAAYKATKKPIGVNISAENKRLDGGKYDIIWHITETKAKKKRSTDDEGQKLDE